jgi:hypothetical protein
MPSDRAVAFIRATNRSVEPASHREDRGDVVRRRQQQRLQRLPLGQLLALGDGHDRLLLSGPAVRVVHVVTAERDRRAVLA